ncbi:MAG: response regulator [Polyangiaceae bacterium]|jgi:CheY-like chemotaxis protein|nr:response regulator [Polyangiaceae bacterium]
MRGTLDTLPEYELETMPLPHAALPSIPAQVLVAEDDAAMRELVTTALEGDGYHVHEAADGLAFASRLSQLIFSEWPKGPIDVIVSDLRMPTFSGLDIIEALREAGVQTPIVLMTAFPSDETRERARQLDTILFDKPFELDDLRACVTRLVQAKQPPH